MARMSGATFRNWGYAAAALAVLCTIVVFGFAHYRNHFAADVSRWNVLLVTLDTTRPDHLGCYGYLRAHTPSIDRLSASSIRYERCYTPAPLTLPAHCSLMTGLDPPRHGVHVNRQVLSSDANTLSEILKQHGYATGAVVGAFVLDRRFGLAQGFDAYDDNLSKGHDPGRFNYVERDAAAVTDAAIAWWSKPHDRPKFMWVHYFDPHSPYAPPGYDPATSPFTPYDAEIAFLDQQLARLLSAVDVTQSHTLIILTADHGEGLGEHGEHTHGLFTYESTLRVPLLVQFPDRRRAIGAMSEPVSLIDVTPSVLHWLGLSAPVDLDGRCLPLSNALATDSAEPRSIFFENEYTATSYGWSPLRGIIAGNWKLIDAPRPERYDLVDDPQELENRFDTNDPHSRELAEKLSKTVTRLSKLQIANTSATDVDEHSLRKLRSLGYVSETTNSGELTDDRRRTDAPDPKDMVGVYDQIHVAMAHVGAGQVARGVGLLVETVDSQPQQPPARAVRTLAALVMEDRDARRNGIPCLKRIAERPDWQTNERSVFESLGVALIEEGRHAEAILPLLQLMKLEPDHAAAHYLLGRSYRETGDSRRAIEHFEHAIKLVNETDDGASWLADANGQLEALTERQKDEQK